MITAIGIRGARRMRAARARRARRPPALRVHPGARGAGGQPAATVYYLCPDFARASGGIKVIYQHVDQLNAAGIPAAVLHHKTGFSCGWFRHETRVRGADEVTLSARDVLVVPEIYGPWLSALPHGPRIVVFNQNAYLTFDCIEPAAARRGAPYRDLPGLAGLLTVSADNADYLRFAFPELRVSVVANAIDPAVFHPADPAGDGAPPRRVALMPRKRPADAAQVLNLLGAHGGLADWEQVSISARTELETAELMRSCPIFLSFAFREGFGLPAAEAMASGCYVIGFPGLAGREFFDPEYSAPIEDGDVGGFARTTARVLAEYEKDPAPFRAAGRIAAERIHAVYSPGRQRRELAAFYRSLLDGE
jgi:glycosyltransferase involved in cell wall biosynthesis